MPRSLSYRTYLMEMLQNPEEAAAYLNAALEEGDMDMFWVALKNVAEAWGSLGEGAEVSQPTKEDLQNALSEEKDNVDFRKILGVLHEMGFKLNITVKTAA